MSKVYIVQYIPAKWKSSKSRIIGVYLDSSLASHICDALNKNEEYEDEYYMDDYEVIE